MRTLLIITFIALYLSACSQTNSKKNNPYLANTTTLMPGKMDTTDFWTIIDNAFEKGRFDNKIKEQTILEQLVKLSPEQIQEFEIIFQQLNKKASTWQTLAAQTVIEGGTSDDRFYYFRCWLISLGQRNFDATLVNPDHLASLDIPVDEYYGEVDCQFEELIPIADRAYEIVTHKDPETDTTFPRSHADKSGLFYDSYTELTGVEWQNNELPSIVPTLYKKYIKK